MPSFIKALPVALMLGASALATPVAMPHDGSGQILSGILPQRLEQELVCIINDILIPHPCEILKDTGAVKDLKKKLPLGIDGGKFIKEVEECCNKCRKHGDNGGYSSSDDEKVCKIGKKEFPRPCETLVKFKKNQVTAPQGVSPTKFRKSLSKCCAAEQKHRHHSGSDNDSDCDLSLCKIIGDVRHCPRRKGGEWKQCRKMKGKCHENSGSESESAGSSHSDSDSDCDLDRCKPFGGLRHCPEKGGEWRRCKKPSGKCDKDWDSDSDSDCDLSLCKIIGDLRHCPRRKGGEWKKCKETKGKCHEKSDRESDSDSDCDLSLCKIIGDLRHCPRRKDGEWRKCKEMKGKCHERSDEDSNSEFEHDKCEIKDNRRHCPCRKDGKFKECQGLFGKCSPLNLRL